MAPYNKQLQRTVPRHRGRAASASFHYALAARYNRQRAAAELRGGPAFLDSFRGRDKWSPAVKLPPRAAGF